MPRTCEKCRLNLDRYGRNALIVNVGGRPRTFCSVKCCEAALSGERKKQNYEHQPEEADAR